MTEKEKRGSWKPFDEKYANDRFMITHTGYLVDTETDVVYLTIQAFLNFVNDELLKENGQLKSDAKYWGKTAEARLKEIDRLREKNEELKQQIEVLELYRKLVKDVLIEYTQKDLTAKQLGIICAIMQELYIDFTGEKDE